MNLLEFRSLGYISCINFTDKFEILPETFQNMAECLIIPSKKWLQLTLFNEIILNYNVHVSALKLQH